MALQSLDIKRRSATTLPEPEIRVPVGTREVAKLIDTTKCIGCKACQVACMEWNDLRDTVGTNIGLLLAGVQREDVRSGDVVTG